MGNNKVDVLPTPPKDIPPQQKRNNTKIRVETQTEHGRSMTEPSPVSPSYHKALPSPPPMNDTGRLSIPTAHPVAPSSAPASIHHRSNDEEPVKFALPELSKFKSTVTPVLVAVRVRPPTLLELGKKEGTTQCVEVVRQNGANQVRIKGPKDFKQREFSYDAVCRQNLWGDGLRCM
jgi:hypothetical protein